MTQVNNKYRNFLLSALKSKANIFFYYFLSLSFPNIQEKVAVSDH